MMKIRVVIITIMSQLALAKIACCSWSMQVKDHLVDRCASGATFGEIGC